MIFTFIASFAVGYMIGAIAAYCIDVVNEWLSTQRAKELARERVKKKINKLIIKNVTKNAEYGETISAHALDESNEYFADITFHAAKGSALYSGQVLYN